MSDIKCPKCGFKSTENAMVVAERKFFKLEYKDRCWKGECSWADTDVKEHLHIICPTCGYDVDVRGCDDYKEKKSPPEPKAWTEASAKVLPKQAPAPSKYVAGKGYIDAPASVGGWDTTVECPSCPMASEVEKA